MGRFALSLLLLRRFLWVAAYAFWMGGFSFYGGVVIPVGSRVVAGGEAEFGFITRRVTYWLNVSGEVALAIFLINLFIDRRVPTRWGRWALFSLWLATATLHGGLLTTHRAMDLLLDPTTLNIRESGHFHRLHEAYLLMSSLQWAASLVLLAVTLWICWIADRSTTN